MYGSEVRVNKATGCLASYDLVDNYGHIKKHIPMYRKIGNMNCALVFFDNYTSQYVELSDIECIKR